ncbi:MAG: 3-deoxy-8-phosphooctulonate synthase [Bacteroidia bacterium]
MNENRFWLIAGPCVVENWETCALVAEKAQELAHKYNFFYVFKASYRKANRTQLTSFSGVGDEEALRILARVKETFHVPVLTDIHETHEAFWAAQVADILQIPAFLSRQTALLQAAGQTQKTVNIKKGQFLSADAMRYAAQKVAATGNPRILLTERGTFFGYQDLVVDFRNIIALKEIGYPVILDITHSVQKPNRPEGVSGGDPHYIGLYARLGVVAGVDGIFLETHPQPEKALSDGTNMLALDRLPTLMAEIAHFHQAYQKWPITLGTL